MNQPSRWLLIVAGLLTQVVGSACLILNVASLPFAHDLHARTHSIIASIIAALATIVCGTLVWRGRLIPIALAAGLDVGFGIGLPRGSAAIGTLMKVLSADDIAKANGIITAAAITMFVAAILCVLAIPSALRLRQWARDELKREELAARGAESEKAKQRLSTGHIVPAAASTLRGVGPKLMPTQVIRIDGGQNKWRPLIIVGVAVSMIAIGIVVITAAMGSSKEKDPVLQIPNNTGSAVVAKTPVDAAVIVAVPVDAATPTDPPVEEVIARLHLALEHAKADELGLLFDSKSFGFGVEANEIAEGRDAIVAMLRHDLGDPPAKGFEVVSRFSQHGHEGDTGWIGEELKVGSKVFITTAVVALADGAWTIEAIHWAQAMPNDEAYRRARDGSLAVPDAIPNSHDESKLAEAMRQGFASKPSFVTARSNRDDGMNFGSAPGERIVGGDNVKKIFSRIKASIHLHGDAIKVGPAGAKGGWGAANVEFTDNDKDGIAVTQTFRVLVAWLQDETGNWRMVQSQFSNPR
ncbi:MAG: nuclear transport factor 2 family protein [Kofleriaceae bacterium]